MPALLKLGCTKQLDMNELLVEFIKLQPNIPAPGCMVILPEPPNIAEQFPVATLLIPPPTND